MKKLIFSAAFIFVSGLAWPTSSFAQGMPAPQNNNGHTAREEAEGKAVWEKFQAKTLTCRDLSADNFGTLGEYFMGQTMGDSHEAMNNMMIQMMGEEGEKQIHIVMGKRSSGCNTSAAFPSPGVGFMPMMNMMNSGFMYFGWIFMILWWALIILGLVALIKWLMAQSRGSHNHEKPASLAGQSPLEILKERYARGEIDKKEFAERKRDLS